MFQLILTVQMLAAACNAMLDNPNDVNNPYCLNVQSGTMHFVVTGFVDKPTCEAYIPANWTGLQINGYTYNIEKANCTKVPVL